MNTFTFNGWIASLSNGETVNEQPPVPGEKSAWQKLLDRLTAENLTLTQLRLQSHGTTVICDFHKKIDGYAMAYEVTKNLFRGGDTKVQGIGSILNEAVFMTWLDDDGNVRQEIRPLSEMRIHSTLRDAHDTTRSNQLSTV